MKEEVDSPMSWGWVVIFISKYTAYAANPPGFAAALSAPADRNRLSRLGRYHTGCRIIVILEHPNSRSAG